MTRVGSALNHTLEIGDTHLTLADVAELAMGNLRLRITDKSWSRIRQSQRMVERAISGGDSVYGVTTGFGALSERTISADTARELQINLLRSHASGTGAPLSDQVTRIMLALRIHALCQGYSGVRPELLKTLVAMFNAGILAVVPSQGSVGASGDLAPLAHLALPVTGEGLVRVAGRETQAAEALHAAGIKPVTLEPKEALALINGTQAMTAVGALSSVHARRVFDGSVAAGALVVIALDGRLSSFDELVQSVRPHRGQQVVASRLRMLLDGWNAESPVRRPVQDRYSLRALPQVLGPILDTMTFTESVLEIEINSVTDNPLFFPEADRIINGANFHGHPVALACDHLKTAIASLTTFSERRIASLVDPRASSLPGFLAQEPGLNSGLMIPHYLAASLVSENRVLAHPASVDSLSTSADVEDYNSMGMLASRNLASVVENASRVVAIELLCAAQAIDLRSIDPSAVPAGRVYEQVRETIPFLDRDRFGIGGWVEDLAGQIRDGSIAVPVTESDSGPEVEGSPE